MLLCALCMSEGCAPVVTEGKQSWKVCLDVRSFHSERFGSSLLPGGIEVCEYIKDTRVLSVR